MTFGDPMAELLRRGIKGQAPTVAERGMLKARLDHIKAFNQEGIVIATRFPSVYAEWCDEVESGARHWYAATRKVKALTRPINSGRVKA